MAWVAVLMGSESDWPVMEACHLLLDELQIQHEVRITSAHRTPQDTADYVVEASQRGCEIFICAAGMAAHLAGAVAAQSLRPVIGVPIDSGSLAGLDALLSTVQMPGGIPVATVAIGKAGAKNAAYLAAQILALNDPALGKRLADDRKTQRARIGSASQGLQSRLQLQSVT